MSQGKEEAEKHNVPRMDTNEDRRKEDAELVTGQEEAEIFEGITVIHAAGCRARRRMEPCNLKTMMRTPAWLNGVELVVLNDSGAEVSVMSAAAAAEAHLEVTSLKRKDAQVCNADGSPFQMEGVVETTIRLGTKDWPLRAYVLKKLQTPVLLGEDFLEKAEAELSYGRRTVSYGGEEVNIFKPPRYGGRNYRDTDGTVVEMQEEVTLEPETVQTVMLIPGFPEELKAAQFAWRFVPFEMIQMGLDVTIPEALVGLNRGYQIAVRIWNRSKKEVVIKKEMMMGQLRILETDPEEWEEPRRRCQVQEECFEQQKSKLEVREVILQRLLGDDY